jgi:hypothetical protein
MFKKFLFFLLFSAIATLAQTPSVNSIGPSVVYSAAKPIPIVCNAINEGRVFWVSDATTLTGTYVSGGSFIIPVSCVGTSTYSWISLVSGNLVSSPSVTINNDTTTGATTLVTNVQNTIQQFIQAPATGYSTYVAYPTTGVVTVSTGGGGAAVDARSAGIVALNFGGHYAVQWSGFSLPASITSGSIHAIIPFMVGSGYGIAQNTDSCIGGGGTYFPTGSNDYPFGTYTMGAVGSPTLFDFSTATCTADSYDSLDLNAGGGQQVSTIGYLVEYTGTPIATTTLNIVAPLSFNSILNQLSLSIPFDYAGDTGIADAYVVNIPAITMGTVGGTLFGAGHLGQTGQDIKFLPLFANATTTPTLNVTDSYAFPYGPATIIKCGGAALAVGDISPVGINYTYTGIAHVIWDGQFFELQNPQTGCGSGSTSVVNVNGTPVSSPNLQNSGTVTFGVTGSNIQATAASGGGGAWTNISSAVTWIGCTYASGVCTVTGPFGNLDISAIPGTYSNIKIVAVANTSSSYGSGQTFNMIVNADSGNNYDSSVWETNPGGTGAVAQQATGAINLTGVAGSSVANSSTALELFFPQYANSTSGFWKICQGTASEEYSGGVSLATIAGAWHNTVPITELTFQMAGNYETNGSTWQIFGQN